jgi:hypothetical protein
MAFAVWQLCWSSCTMPTRSPRCDIR